MHRVHYAGNSILTGTAIARALLEYAQALAEAGSSATVDVPTINDDGTPGRSDILVGPASQLIADAEESTHQDVADQPLVEYLDAETQRLRRHGSSSPVLNVDGSAQPPEWTDFDL